MQAQAYLPADNFHIHGLENESFEIVTFFQDFQTFIK